MQRGSFQPSFLHLTLCQIGEVGFLLQTNTE